MRALASVLAAALCAAMPAGGQDWPQFRGPKRDGVLSQPATIAAFPAQGPELLWDRTVGAGFSGPAVAGGRLVLFHRLGSEEVVEVLRPADGKALWKFSYETRYRDDFGFDNGPRATPVVADGRVLTFGAQGMLHALDLRDGRKLWAIDTHRAFGVRKGFFGAASTPLVLDGKVIANIGGADGAGIVAFDAGSGKVLWKATDHEASYSSPVAATLGGRESAVFFTREGLAVLDPADGAVLYERRWRSRSRASVNAAAPVVDGETVFLTASYGTGAIALRVSGGDMAELWSGEGVLDSHYASCVLVGGTLYGFHGRQEHGQSLRAVDLRSGKQLWSHGPIRAGSVTAVGDRLVLLLESGELVLAAASRAGFEAVARAQVFAGETRAFPAIANGLLFARDRDTLACYRLWSE